MKFVIHTIIHAHVVILIIISVSYILEKLTPWKSIIYIFKRPKNFKKATAAADFHTGLYFIICLLTLLYDFYKKRAYIPDDYKFWKWLVIMIPLVVIFQKLYYKFTAKDPDRADDDWG